MEQNQVTDYTTCQRCNKAIDMAISYGGIDGDHHKSWVIDQIVQILSDKKYKQVVIDARQGEDGPHTYEWNKGIAP